MTDESPTPAPTDRLRDGRLAGAHRRRVHVRERPALRRRGRHATSTDRGEAAKGVVIAYDRRFASEHFAAAAAEVVLAHDIPVALRRPRRPDPDELVRGRRARRRRRASSSPPATTRGSTTGSRSRPRPGPPAAPTCSPRSRRRLAVNGGLAIDRRPLADAEAAGDCRAVRPVRGLRAVRPPDRRPRRAQGRRHAGPRRPDVGRRGGLDLAAAGRRPDPGRRDPPGAQPVLRRASTRSRSGPTSTRRSARIAGGGYDLGLLLDGDADRAGAADEQGTFIHQLQVTGLLMYYLAEHRGWRDPVVVSVNNTSMAARLGEHYGIATHETPVGFKFIGPKMIETGAMMGAEESGGFGFGMHLPERDGIYADLLLLDLFLRERAAGRWPVSRGDRALPRARRAVVLPAHRRPRRPGRSTPRRSGGCWSTSPARPPTELAGEPVARTVALDTGDGFKFFLADGSWLLIRASGTEPLVRVYTEATSAGPARGAARRRRAAGPRRMSDAAEGPTRGGSTSRGATS